MQRVIFNLSLITLNVKDVKIFYLFNVFILNIFKYSIISQFSQIYCVMLTISLQCGCKFNFKVTRMAITSIIDVCD